MAFLYSVIYGICFGFCFDVVEGSKGDDEELYSISGVSSNELSCIFIIIYSQL